MNKQILTIIIVIIAILGFGAVGWFYYYPSTPTELSKTEQPTIPIPTQSTQKSSEETKTESQTPPPPTKSPLEAIKKIIPPRVPTLEETVKKHANAAITKTVVTIWEDMHPDDKLRWRDKEEYISEYNRLVTVTYTSFKTKETKSIDAWVHPITQKVYGDIKEVVEIVTAQGVAESSELSNFYQKVTDRWYFFSQLLSASDRAKIKAEAKPGVSYKELSKSPDKYKGQRVRYTGKVIQIQEEQGGSGFLRLSVTPTEFGYSYDDIIYVSYTQPTDALQDDIVTIYGILSGAISYTSQAGYLITVPGMEAAVIEKTQ